MNNMMFPTKPHCQQGAVLIMGLVLLMALTIVGVASLNNNTLQSRMAGNLIDSNLAFNAAETASRALQASLSPDNDGVSSCSGQTFDGTLGSAKCVLERGDSVNGRNDISWMENTDHKWWTDSAGGGLDYVQTYTGNYSATVHGDNGGDKIISTAPRVIVEEHATVGQYGQGLTRRNLTTGTKYYRLTVRGTGSSDNSQAMIQQIVSKHR